MFVVTVMIYDLIETLNTIIDDDGWYATMPQSTEHCTEQVVNKLIAFSVVDDIFSVSADVQEQHIVPLSCILYHT